MMLINLYVKNLFEKSRQSLKHLASWVPLFAILTLLYPVDGRAGEIQSKDLSLPKKEKFKIESANLQSQDHTVTLPKKQVEVAEKEKTPSEPEVDESQEQNLQALNAPNPAEEKCQTTLVGQDLEKKYHEIQKRLESDFKRGMPKQLRTDLTRVRKDIDELIGQLFDVDDKNPQEVNHIVNRTIDYLEKMITLLPKANKIAPMVRDRYVIPFTNISSIKAEHEECLMKHAVAEVKESEKDLASSNEPSINIYRKLTEELKNLNQNLYTLQTTDVQKFINFRADLLYKLEKFNQKKGKGSQVTANIPKVLNSVHTEIERLLPGLQLSENFYSTFD